MLNAEARTLFRSTSLREARLSINSTNNTVSSDLDPLASGRLDDYFNTNFMDLINLDPLASGEARP